MFRNLTILIALAGIFAASMLVKRLRHVEPPPPPLAEPAHAPFDESIGARGLVESVNENVRIASALPGLVTRVLVKVGDRVKAGDALFEQDTRDANAILKSQESQVASMKAQIDEAAVTVADKKDSLMRIEKLMATKVSSEDERQRAYFAAREAEAHLATMRAQLDSAQAQLERQRVQLDLLTTRAPRDGRILQVNTRAGEYLSADFAGMNPSSDPPILLGEVEQLQLRADVDEDNASRVRPGCAAVAYIKGRRDHPIPLKFERIEPYIVPKRSLTGESTERVDTRVLQIIFRFDAPQTPVYVGQQMDVFLDGAAAVRAL